MFVDKLELKNFKSFRDATVHVVDGFNAIVGPNGSGKTNIVDAVLFALGESRIRHLRAKKTQDLIYKDSKIAEVRMHFAGGKNGEKATVSRAIRRDGKLRYSLNGKHSHRYVIEDFLRGHGVSTYNIIQQGEVQRIVEMSSKERRGLVDNIANVTEYEDKKREALSKLEDVEAKLRSDTVLLNEREGMLDALKKDKADAERHIHLTKHIDAVRATLLYEDVRGCETEFANLINSLVDLKRKNDALLSQSADLQSKVDARQAEKDLVNQQISQRSEGKQIILEKELDELKSEIARCSATIDEKRAEVQRLEERIRSLSGDKTKAADEVRGVLARISRIQEDAAAAAKMLKDEQGRLDAVLKESDRFSADFFSNKKLYDDLQAQMLASKEKLASLQAEAGKTDEVSRLKQNELERLGEGKAADYSGRASNAKKEKDSLGDLLRSSEKTLSSLFDKEKELNRELEANDRDLMAAKMKSVEIGTRLQNLKEFEVGSGVQYVLSQKDKDEGIHGTVEQLCAYESKHAVPVQVAVGGRMSFVVVDGMRTAQRLITHLKSKRLGRVSFIPMDKIRPHEFTKQDIEHSQAPGSQGFVLHLLTYDKTYENVFKFVCGSTLLVSSLSAGEKLVGKTRFVTEEGELSESSGLVTGGSFSARVNVRKEKELLDQYDKLVATARARKEDLLKQIYDVQEGMSTERKRRAELEVKSKALELELENYSRNQSQEDEKSRNLKGAAAALKKEIGDAAKVLQKIESEKAEIIRSLSDLNIRALDAKAKIDVEKEKNFGVMLKEREKRVMDLKLQSSDLSNQLSALQTEAGAYERELKSAEKSLADANAEMKLAEETRKHCKASIEKDKRLVDEKTAELKSISAAMRDLIEKREAIEKDVYSLATRKGKLEFEREKIASDLQRQEVAKAVSETNLANLKAEFAKYEGVQRLDEKDRAQLTFMLKQSEQELAALGTVNLKAVEEYDIRAKDFDAQKLKVQQLANEKQAVIAMINEIEGRKIATFMETFKGVNDYFQKLFTQIFNGTGSLFLENENSPFEGGLTIKIELKNKTVKYLELMSGGEKSLIALLFIFSIQSYSPSTIYILDEADAALDQENSRKLADLLKQLSKGSQFLVVTHNQTVYRSADCLLGVAMTKHGSQLVEVKLGSEAAERPPEASKGI
ncbi:MAG: AAA family ATPase [Candidatus Micrarchaeota archaeon]